MLQVVYVSDSILCFFVLCEAFLGNFRAVFSSKGIAHILIGESRNDPKIIAHADRTELPVSISFSQIR